MIFLQTWGEVFTGSLQSLWFGFVTFVPSLLGAVILFVLGWIVGSIICKAVVQLFTTLKIDKLFESAGANEAFQKAGLRLNVGGFIGGLFKWFIIVAFMMASLEIMGLTQVNDFLRETVIYYLPKVAIAALVLIIATVIAETMKKVVSASAKAANVTSANMLGSIANYAIWIFAFIVAFSELGIASAFMQILFTGLIAALALAFGLAFGIGGRDAAARAIENVSKDISK